MKNLKFKMRNLKYGILIITKIENALFRRRNISGVEGANISPKA